MNPSKGLEKARKCQVTGRSARCVLLRSVAGVRCGACGVNVLNLCAKI